MVVFEVVVEDAELEDLDWLFLEVLLQAVSNKVDNKSRATFFMILSPCNINFTQYSISKFSIEKIGAKQKADVLGD